MSNKAKLRKEAFEKRKSLDAELFMSLNESLIRQLLDFIRSKNYQSIHFFLPIIKNNEPDFSEIFPLIWKEGRKIMVSKTNLKNKILSHYWLEPSTKIEVSSWGIPEPIDAQIASIDQAELIVVPLLLADRVGHRLGYGGGFYDKLLANYNGSTVGVSLLPPVENIPIEPWDIPLQKILFA